MGNNLMNLDALENYLRSAQPRLIVTCESKGERIHELTPYISEVDHGWDEVISEGFDPDFSPLGCPVYSPSGANQGRKGCSARPAD